MVGVSYYYPELTPNINRAMRTKTKKAASSKVKVEVVANNLDFDPVVVSQSKAETASGIVVAGSVMADYEPCEGTVMKVGEGRMTSNGEFSSSPVKVGDRVKFRDYAGNGVKIEGVEHSLVRMVDILCGLEA